MVRMLNTIVAAQKTRLHQAVLGGTCFAFSAAPLRCQRHNSVCGTTAAGLRYFSISSNAKTGQITRKRSAAASVADDVHLVSQAQSKKKRKLEQQQQEQQQEQPQERQREQPQQRQQQPIIPTTAIMDGVWRKVIDTDNNADSHHDDEKDCLLRGFRCDASVKAIQSVLNGIETACAVTSQPDLWDNYGWREHLINCWLKIAYGIDDIRRSSGRSGPDCTSEKGQRQNIEVKTSLFRKRRRLTLGYELGQFSRQHTPEVRQFIHTLDAIVYAVFQDGCTVPLCLFCLHGEEAMQAHSAMIGSKQQEFLERHRQNLNAAAAAAAAAQQSATPEGKQATKTENAANMTETIQKNRNGAKGGRDTIKIKGGDLCLALSVEKKTQQKDDNVVVTYEPVNGFDVWIGGKSVSNWHQFVHKMLHENGVELLKKK